MTFNFILLVVLLAVVIGFIVVVLIKNRTVGLVIAAVPGSLGLLSLLNYYLQWRDCNPDPLCEMGQAGMLLFYGVLLCLLSVIAIVFVLILHKVRQGKEG